MVNHHCSFVKHHIIPIFISHRGCPFQCVFCNQVKINGEDGNVSSAQVSEIIERHLEHPKAKQEIVEVAFFGGSFTCMPIEYQISLLSAAMKYKKSGQISFIRVSTRPDGISLEVLENLKKHGVDIVELGVQSMDDEVLRQTKRGYVADRINHAVRLLREFEFQIGLQMMVGLPGDNYEKTRETAMKLSLLSPDFVRIYPTLVVRNTELERNYNAGFFQPLSISEAVNTCTDLLLFFEWKKISVIRIGLQPSENLTWGRDVIAGPFHPSFRQLVESMKYRKLLDMYFRRLDVSLEGTCVIFQCMAKRISDLMGQKRENLHFFSDQYGILEMKFISAEEDVFIIDIAGKEYGPNLRMLSKEYLEKNTGYKAEVCDHETTENIHERL